MTEEAKITINNVRLTEKQSTAVRVALEKFGVDIMFNNDEESKKHNKLLGRSLTEIQSFLYK